MDARKKIPKSKRVERKKFILDFCRGKSVLHLGCTGGLLDRDSIDEYVTYFDKENDTHCKIASVSSTVAGIDISKQKIQAMKKAGVSGDLYVGDLCDAELNISGDYDVVVFANLIEHLDNVGISLQNCKKWMRDDSRLLITTNNPFDFKLIAKLVFNYESVHIEHTSYYSYLTLSRILEMNGLKVEAFYWASNERLKFDGFIDRFSYKISDSITKVFKQFSQDLIVVASKK